MNSLYLHGMKGRIVFEAENSGNEVRFLLLSSLPPYPTTAGGNQRTNLVYRALSSIGRVDLLLIHSFGNEDEATLKRDFGLIDNVGLPAAKSEGIGRRPLAHFFDSLQRLRLKYAPDARARSLLTDTLQKTKYDFIISRHLVPATASGALESGVPVIVDLDDVDHLRHASQLAALRFSLPGRMRLSGETYYIRHHVKRVSRGSVHVWLVREEDKACVPCRSLSLLPNIPFDSAVLEGNAPPAGSSGRTILFVGSFDYIVNVRAVDYFVRNIWPGIREKAPDAVFRLVGREGGNTAFAQLAPTWRATPGVELVGSVDDLREAYRDCAFAVCPINEGAGTKIKVVESLAHGRACVVSRHSYRGYESHLEHDKALLVAHDDGEFARHCLDLLGDSAKAARLAETGQQIVRRVFVYDAFEAHVRETIERLRHSTQQKAGLFHAKGETATG